MSIRSRVVGHQGGQAPAARGTNLQLRGEDRIEHRLLEAWGPQHEDILQDVEDQATVWPGADQPGLQEGGPLLLQSPKATLVPLEGQRQCAVGAAQMASHVNGQFICPHPPG